MAQTASFKELLNDPEGRRLVDAIEDTLGSLRGREDDTDLQRILKQQIDELEAKTGYRYQL